MKENIDAMICTKIWMKRTCTMTDVVCEVICCWCCDWCCGCCGECCCLLIRDDEEGGRRGVWRWGLHMHRRYQATDRVWNKLSLCIYNFHFPQCLRSTDQRMFLTRDWRCDDARSLIPAHSGLTAGRRGQGWPEPRHWPLIGQPGHKLGLWLAGDRPLPSHVKMVTSCMDLSINQMPGFLCASISDTDVWFVIIAQTAQQFIVDIINILLKMTTYDYFLFWQHRDHSLGDGWLACWVRW